jgi:BolA protein
MQVPIMTMQSTIQQKLSAAFHPLNLEVINESDNHNVPPGSESHFKVVVVSKAFEGESLIKRHRQVNQVLADELKGGIHALALHTMTPEEWFNRGGTSPTSPECLGGSKQH